MAESRETAAAGLPSFRERVGMTIGLSELTSYQTNPVRFVREVLGSELWSRQVEILEAIRDHPQVTVRSGHGVGKTFVAACAALWWLYSFRPSLVLTTAPTARQVESLLWGEIRRL
jgi:hypothetical protein